MNELDRQALNAFRHEHQGVVPRPEEENRLLKLVRRAEGEMIKIISSGDQKVSWDLLKEDRAADIARYGRVPSIPNLCAVSLIGIFEIIVVEGYISPQLKRIRSRPEYLSTRDDIVQTVGWCDVLDGAINTLGAVFVAEREIAGRSDQAITAIAALVSESAGDVAEIYLRLRPDLQEFSSDAARLLLSEEGRTGLPLLDAQVQRLERVKLGQELLPSHYHPFQIVSMLLAGAEMARESYRVLYPLAEKLPPAQL